MINKKFLINVMVPLCLAAVCFNIINIGAESYAADSISNSRYRMSFAVLSDIHGDGIKLDNALKDLHNNVDNDYSVLILNGDMVDQGKQSQYDVIEGVLEKNEELLPEKVVKNIGNHEFFDYRKRKNKQEYSEQLLNLYLNFSSEEHTYHDTWVKGYHFISLGTEKGNTSDMDNSCQAYLSDAQLNWLKDKLDEKYKKGRPIFVFLHQPLNNTFITTFNDCNNAIKQDSSLRIILSQYPEVIIFTSHTHFWFNDKIPERTNFLPHLQEVNKGFALVDTSSVHRPVNYEGQKPPFTSDKEMDAAGCSQGLFVDVYSDKVIMRGREFSNSTWIEGAEFVVNYNPFDIMRLFRLLKKEGIFK